MKSFLTLVYYEYQKLFKRKRLVFALLIALLLSVFSCVGVLFGTFYMDGHPFEKNYDGMLKDRAYARALSGRPLDTELLIEAASAYATIPEHDVYQATDAYQSNARPYSEIYDIARGVLSTPSTRFGMEDFQALTNQQAENFYSTRQMRIANQLHQTQLNETEQNVILYISDQIKTPFIFNYTEGYTRFFTIMYTTGIIIAFIAAFALSPLFAGEYTAGTDPLLLTSKYGKTKLIHAKLFTGLSFSGLIAIFFTLQTYVECMLIFGPDGANAPLQLYIPLSPYPLTMMQSAVYLAFTVFFASLMVASLTMVLSSKVKTPFISVVIMGLLLIVPMFISISEDNLLLYRLLKLLPTNMVAFWNVISTIPFNIAGIVIKPYFFPPCIAIFTSLILLKPTASFFRNHSV